RYRFAVLLVEIKQAEVLPYVAAVLGVINCIILGACGFRLRTRVRNEFLALGLLDLLESLKQLPDEEVQLQCSVFVKSQMADED
ncbi:Inverted formin-2, partial [Stegodyphus mimosarum]